MNGIDIEPLLKEISPEAPSGQSDPANDPTFIDLEIKIEGTPEREFGGEIVQEAKDPNWNKIKDAAVALLTRAHDLRVVMFLTRALLHTDGLHGLGSGLALMTGLISRYWDSFYPQLDPEDNNDPIQRINILAALSEGEDILGPLKKKILCTSRSLGQYSYRDILIASGKIDAAKDDSPPPNMVDIEAAFKDSETEDLLANKEAINTARNNLSELRNELKTNVGDPHTGTVPDFENLSKVLTEMDAIMQTQLQGRADLQSSDTDQSADTAPGATSPSSTAPPAGTVNNRQDVIRLLDQICKYYQNNEPGSPVPLLLKRARHLVEKDFIEIIQNLAPDSAAKIKNLISGAED